MSENPDNVPVSENPDTYKGLLANPNYGRVQVRVTDEMVARGADATLQLHNERLREALDNLISIINSAVRASESRAHKANDVYEEAVLARMPPVADERTEP